MADELQVVVEKIVADSSASQANLLNKILKKLHLFSANEEADTYQRGAGVIEKLALGLTKTSELLKKCERDCQQAKARYLPMIRQYEVSRLRTSKRVMNSNKVHQRALKPKTLHLFNVKYAAFALITESLQIVLLTFLSRYSFQSN